MVENNRLKNSRGEVVKLIQELMVREELQVEIMLVPLLEFKRN